MTNSVISNEAGRELEEAYLVAVKSFVQFMNTAVEGLGIIPMATHLSPISRDYVAFNA